MSRPLSSSSLPVDLTASRYSRPLDPNDRNSAHTLAVMAVPPGSFVLDVGAADGSVARALTAKGCRVWGIERDAAAAQAAEPWCERVLCADVEHLAPDALGTARFDVVLLLDVLEHLVDPPAALKRLTSMLHPQGRVIASIPNVTHAAVRLQLLQGKFPRTEIGLLDATHLHFFDRESMQAMFRGAGLAITDHLRTRRLVHDTEIPVDLDAVPAAAVRQATRGIDGETYQFFVIAIPGGTGASVGDSLLEALQRRVDQLEDSYRQLEGYARNLERALAEAQSRPPAPDARTAARAQAAEEERERHRLQIGVLEQHLQHLTAMHAAAVGDAGELRDRASQAAGLRLEADGLRIEAEALRGSLRDLEDRLASRDADIRHLTSRLADSDARHAGAALELKDARRLAAQLRRDLSLREAYVSELRTAAATLTADLTAAHADAGAKADSLAVAVRRADDERIACERIASDLQARVRQLEQTAAERADMPRYRLADKVNRAIKHIPFVHWAAKRCIMALSSSKR